MVHFICCFLIVLVKIKSKKHVINARRCDIIDHVWKNVTTMADTYLDKLIVSSNVTSIMW